MQIIKFFFIKAACLFFSMLLVLIFSVSSIADNFYKFDVDVKSKAVYFVNEDTGTVVYDKNPDEKVPSAALVKLMTVSLILDNVPSEEMDDFLGTKIEATGEIFDRLFRKKASNVDIRKGEEVPVIDLLYASILASACEATMMLVDHVTKTWPKIFGRNVDEFVDFMNSKKLHEAIGLKNTNFTDPDGLDDVEQQTTARDAYKLTKHCLKNALLKKIATTSTYKMAATGFHPNPRDIIHTNHMTNIGVGGRRYYDKRVLGLKTGAYDDYFNLISSAHDDSYTYILVVLGAPKTKGENSAFVDSNNLYDYAFKNLKFETVSIPGEKLIPNNVKVKLGKGTDNLVLTSRRQITLLLPKAIDRSTIFWDTSQLPKEVWAPLRKGQVVGQVNLKLANKVVDSIDAVVCEDVPLDFIAAVYSCMVQLFKYLWLIILLVVVLLIFLWFVSRSSFVRRRKNKRRIKFKKRGQGLRRTKHKQERWK